MWKSEKRIQKSTVAIYPYSKVIDIGPLELDLWRYLKTDLFNNWTARTTHPKNFIDKYFCYDSRSIYKPKPKHFEQYPTSITPEGVTKHLQKMIVEIEKLKEYSEKDKKIKISKYNSYCRRKKSKLFHI